SEAATGRPFVRYWMHNGFVNLGAEKMSKSLGNTLTIRDMVRRHDPQALRLYLLGTHYRHPLEFADERIAEAARALARLASVKDEAERMAGEGGGDGALDDGLARDVAAHRARFEATMDDDFNTPQALGVLFDLARRLNAARDQVAQGTASARGFLDGVEQFLGLARVLGLLEGPRRGKAPVDARLGGRGTSPLERRQPARKRRDLEEADRLRDDIHRLGAVLEDTSSGTTWKLR